MTSAKLFLIAVILILFDPGLNFGQSESTRLKGPYLGQKVPGNTPEVFAKGIVSTEMEEFSSAFTPDGKEFYFTRSWTDPKTKKRVMTVMMSQMGKPGWTKPVMAPFCQKGSTEGEPNFSSDGKMVLFGRLATTNDGAMDPRVMISERKKNGWSDPIDLMHGMMASITKDNMIYYTDTTQGYSKGDIFIVQYHQGHIHNPQKLTGTINTPQQDAHPYVTPDGKMLLFDSNRPGGYGDNDLYICIRQDDGSWGKAINMGPKVNSDKYDALPYLSYDGKYFFFSRNRDIYWINAEFIKNLQISK